ncbi:MAG TPA: hypothetical protein VGS19_13060 [Streptosporangiaceae bacterium]|nr:hypothetical protein [Streptosporangiaceae bacterium]
MTGQPQELTAPPGGAGRALTLPGRAGRVLTAQLGRAGRALTARPVLCHLVVLGCYLAAGIAVTWPRARYLTDGKLPANRDAGSYVWGFWWVAHQVTHFGNPWYTHAIAAPTGAGLAYHTLMPLEGLVMTPITLAFGPSAAANLLSILVPGLLCYAMYRAARLWLGSQTAAITAGAFFGLSSMLTWRAWYQLNLAVGALFLPLALEAAVRLRRRPGWRQALWLGVVMGASLLSDLESSVMAGILVALVLVPWLLQHPSWDKARVTALAALTGVVCGGPQLAAMAWQSASAGVQAGPGALAGSYLQYGTELEGLFEPSPRVAGYGLTRLGAAYYHDGVVYQGIGAHMVPTSEAAPMYGLVLSLLAVFGLLVWQRRRTAWRFAALWLVASALALGPVLWVGMHAYTPVAITLHGARVSALLPYTWFVQVPGLSGFREAGRLAELGIVPAALLAGAAAGWLRRHAAPALVVVAAAGLLEAGWSGNPSTAVMPAGYDIATMPTAMPALDRPIAADHSATIVVDFPFGVSSGTSTYAARFRPEAQVLATADGHPRAVGYLARAPAPTIAGISHDAFYTGMVRVWRGQVHNTPAQVVAARASAAATHVGWVLVWPQHHDLNGRQVAYWNQGLVAYLLRTGFRFAYQADGVLVYKIAHSQATSGSRQRL